MNYYRQCKLQKDNLFQVAYIPNEFAIVGRTVKIKEGESWEGGWVVCSIAPVKIAESALPDSHKSIKQHRKTTGDSMKKVNNETN